MKTIFAILPLLCLANEQPAQLIDQGMDQFRQGHVEESLARFDKAIEIDPRVKPYLWQRGISQYCLGDFTGGRQQFEIHQDVNPNDVENAAWHYLCVVKIDGPDEARQSLLPIETDYDRRSPMKEIYEFCAGKATENDVLRAANQADTPLSRMYAHLYLGLFEDAAGNRQRAIEHLESAAKEKLKDSYMQVVARVILNERLNAEKSLKKSTNQTREN